MRKTDQLSQKHVNILGVRVDSTPKLELLEKISFRLKKKLYFYIVTPNPEIVLSAQSDSVLRKILNEADFSIPDGVGLGLRPIKGRELMVDLFKIADDLKLKIYLLGARPEVNKLACEKIGKEFSNIKVKGNADIEVDKRGFSLQSDAVIKEINAFKPDIVFVAFGAGKQEKWARENLKCSWMGIGGSLDYFAGFVKPVPKVFERMQLEWLWRLIQEPKRVPRIFKAVVIFPLRVLIGR